MWFNPAEITKAEIPQAANPANSANRKTLQPEKQEKLAELAKLATGDNLKSQDSGNQSEPAKVAEVARVATPPRIETLKDRQREESRQKAISLMNASPDTPRGIYVDDQIDPENIVLFVAVRSCMQTCELLIPRAKYDPFKLLELVERLAVKHG